MWCLARALIMLLLAVGRVSANPCALDDRPWYRLASETVEWSMTIAPGQTCIRGIRSGSITLDKFEVVSAPQSGHLSLQGPAFTYQAAPDFQGIDSFTLLISGKMYRVSGTSTVRVTVIVK
jgi:hypothetical protein